MLTEGSLVRCTAKKKKKKKIGEGKSSTLFFFFLPERLSMTLTEENAALFTWLHSM